MPCMPRLARRLCICLLVAAALVCVAPGAAASDSADRGLVAGDGTLDLRLRGRDFGHLAIGCYDHAWSYAGAVGVGAPDPQGNSRLFTLTIPGGGRATGVASFSRAADGAISAAYTFSAGTDLALNSLHVSVEIPISRLAGGTWTADHAHGSFAKDFAEPTVFSGSIRSLAVAGADGRTLTLTFNVPTQVLIQDNRRWGPSISLRIGTTATLARAESAAIAFQISTPEHLDLDFDRPVTIERGPAWIPLDVDLDIAPGSALDFSTLIRHDAPAGSLGRVIARADGSMASTCASPPSTLPMAMRIASATACCGWVITPCASTTTRTV